MPAGRPKGSQDNPRQRMLRSLSQAFEERGWSEFMPIAEMAVLATEGRIDLQARKAEHAADAERVKAGEMDRADATPRPNNADRAIVSGMFERTAAFLYPRLKAAEISVGGLDGAGPVTVRFARDEAEVPEG